MINDGPVKKRTFTAEYVRVRKLQRALLVLSLFTLDLENVMSRTTRARDRLLLHEDDTEHIGRSRYRWTNWRSFGPFGLFMRMRDSEVAIGLDFSRLLMAAAGG